jgi:hypothetical protein
MASTFTTNTGIEKIGDGEKSGLWGQTTNLNFDIVDRALNGSTPIVLSGTTHTLTTSDGVLSDGQYAVLVFTGALSAPNTVTIAPNTAQKTYWVRNTTSENVILSQGSGANVTVPPGATKAVYTDGAGASAAVVDLTAVFFGTATISGGAINGTSVGATTASSGAFTTLSSVSDISVNGLTVGYGAGSVINNTAVGRDALSSNSGGFQNTAVGSDALSSNTSGIQNTAVGESALLLVTSGQENTALGEGALLGLTTGSLNTAVGRNAGASISTGSGNTIIGRVFGTAALSNTVIVAAGSQERFRVDSSGNMGIGTTSPTERLHVDGKIRIGTQATATTDAVRADRAVATGTGLTGGGNLTADRTLSADISDKSTAEAGTNNTKLMTPLRTAEAIAALSPTTAKATSAQIQALSGSDRFVATDELLTAVGIITPSGASNWTPDWSAFLSANWVVTANRTLANPTNVIPGTTRVVRIVSDASTARTISYGTAYKGAFLPTSTTNAQVIFLTLYAVSSSEVVVAAVEYSV